MYYNTNEETGTTLNSSRKNAIKQEDLVLGIFQKHRVQSLTPEEVNNALEQDGHIFPITSIRRAISTLTNSGKLTKTSKLRGGKYNKNEHVWKFKPQTRQDLNDTHTPGETEYRF